MLRTMVASLAILSAASFKIVSQTFQGNITMKYSTPVIPTPKVATVKMGIDMDGAVKYFMDEHIVIDMPKYNITTETRTGAIFDAATKRYTMYMDTTMKGPTPMPPTPATCKYFEVPTLPAPADFGKCINDIVASAQPSSSEGGLMKFELKIPFVLANASASEEIYTDKDFVMKKVVTDVKINGAHTEMTDMDAKAGAPDASIFVVPKEWGTCVKEALPPMPTQSNPMLQAFLHCMGQGSSQAFLVV